MTPVNIELQQRVQSPIPPVRIDIVYSLNIYCFRLISICSLNLKQEDQVTSYFITETKSPISLLQYKGWGFIFTGLELKA